jgi:hypothetical protein
VWQSVLLTSLFGSQRNFILLAKYLKILNLRFIASGCSTKKKFEVISNFQSSAQFELCENSWPDFHTSAIYWRG